MSEETYLNHLLLCYWNCTLISMWAGSVRKTHLKQRSMRNLISYNNASSFTAWTHADTLKGGLQISTPSTSLCQALLCVCGWLCPVFIHCRCGNGPISLHRPARGCIVSSSLFEMLWWLGHLCHSYWECTMSSLVFYCCCFFLAFCSRCNVSLNPEYQLSP